VLEADLTEATLIMVPLYPLQSEEEVQATPLQPERVYIPEKENHLSLHPIVREAIHIILLHQVIVQAPEHPVLTIMKIIIILHQPTAREVLHSVQFHLPITWLLVAAIRVTIVVITLESILYQLEITLVIHVSLPEIQEIREICLVRQEIHAIQGN
jgi:hypothetical protein